MPGARRRARRIAILAAALAAGCGSGGGDSQAPVDAPSIDAESAAVFRLVEVTDGVYALPVQPERNPSQFAASVIVVRDDHALVVDSRHTPTSARSLIARVRGITDLPIRYLVNTHWHGDHVQGNAAFREAVPDVRIIGGATLAEDMRTLGRERLDAEVADLDRRIAEVSEVLESGVDPDGEPLDEEARGTVERQLELMEAYRAERAGLELVTPDIEVEDELVLDDARPEVRILRVGPAHTRGDVVVHLPSLDILVLGDLIEDGFPWLGDGYPAGWADALDRLAALDARVFLPSHGPVLRDADMFETQRVFMRLLVEEARAAHDRGDGPESIRDNSAFSGLEDHFTRRLRLEGYTLQERQERFDAFLAEAFERAWAEAAGELGPEPNGAER